MTKHVPVVTAVRARGGSVHVDLDGAPWRALPATAALEAGLAAGVELDRGRARVLARSLRRHRAESVALRALAHRDHSRLSLDARLARAGVVPEERTALIERATRSGLVDDERFASTRAEALSARGKGDAWILADLCRQGIADELADAAICGLEPERARAARLVAARGAGVHTARWLAARGFSQETIEELVADLES